MTELPWPNLAAMFFNQVDRFGDEPFLWTKRDGSYRPLSWGDTAARVTPLARSLRALGISAGDRVALVSESRPAWMVSDMAIMAIGAITVPAYTTNTVDDLAAATSRLTCLECHLKLLFHGRHARCPLLPAAIM